MTNSTYDGDPIDGTVQYLGDSGPMNARKSADGETVEATTDDDMHDMTTDHIPSEVDLAELSGKRKEIVETAAKNPTLTATAVDERVGTSGYAAQVLRDECPDWYDSTFKSATPKSKATGPGYSNGESEAEKATTEDRVEFVQEAVVGDPPEEPTDVSWDKFSDNVSFGDNLESHAKLERIRQTCETVAHMDTPVGEFAEGILEVLEE